MAGEPNLPAGRRPALGKRKRRLSRVVKLVTAAVAIGAIAAYLSYRAGRTEVRRPGEDLPEITRKLAADLPESAPLPRLTDVTEEAGLGDYRAFLGARTSQLPEDMGSGAAWADYDNDGDDDLFLVGAGGTLTASPSEWAESVLFENLGGGSFERSSAFPGVRIMGMGAAWGDADGDGRLDLVLTGYNALQLYLNRPQGLVRDERFQAPDGYWAGAAWGDFDNDRDLDLYVTGYVRYEEDASESRRVSQQYATAVPYTLNPATFEPERNLLFENRGDGTFDEVAELWGVSNPGGRSLSALWHDFDADGRLDLYVANDISDNALFLNRGETFEDAGLAAWVADYRGAMGLAAGDWNRDGDDDLFVTHWIAQENALYDSNRARAAAGGGASGAGGQPAIPLAFSDIAARVGLGQPALQAVGWGTEFADLDGDGWLDLAIANGSTLETPEGRLKPQPDMLFWNEDGETFHDLAPLDPGLAAPDVSRGLAVSDYDGDGDLDLLVMRLEGRVRLLRNDMQTGNWLQLKLRSRAGSGEASGFGDGASVTVVTPDGELRRAVGGASYLSQSTRTLHFGLGPATEIARVDVSWLGGELESYTGLEPNALWELREGDSAPRRLGRASSAGGTGDMEMDERARTLAFWERHRAGMDALKRSSDCDTAIGLFRQALELNAEHEDARYYLANCLWALERPDEALAELGRMREISPGSSRAHRQWALVRALNASGDADFAAAEAALERALEINSEETGSLQLLGEVALLRGQDELARERLEWVCQTNPRAVGGFFLRGYLAWKADRPDESRLLLGAARTALGEDWIPEGAVAEGDVAKKMHSERTPLSRFVDAWDGEDDPDRAFRALAAHLASGASG